MSGGAARGAATKTRGGRRDGTARKPDAGYATDFAKRPDSLARDWFSDAEIAESLDRLAARQNDAGGWDITWAVWTPAIAIEWSGLMTIGALKTLRAYGRV